MTPEDAIQAFECLASDEDEDLPAQRAMADLAAIMADEKTPRKIMLALMDVGATLWRMELEARMRI
ncbi:MULTISPECIES: hypothetical protein [Cupriavidus]